MPLTPQLVTTLLDCGHAPAVLNSVGQTPLHLAAAGGHVAVLHALLGASSGDVKDSTGQTPLHAATQANSREAVVLICFRLL